MDRWQVSERQGLELADGLVDAVGMAANCLGHGCFMCSRWQAADPLALQGVDASISFSRMVPLAFGSCFQQLFAGASRSFLRVLPTSFHG